MTHDFKAALNNWETSGNWNYINVETIDAILTAALELAINTQWQPAGTAPKDRPVLLLTNRGAVSGRYCAGEDKKGYWDDDCYEPACWSCHDDEITFICENYGENGEEEFPEILGWMEINFPVGHVYAPQPAPKASK